ncbi:hypothetical protein CK203_015147 [Vitis vinifera]|uniref:Uncharacterized protein n=1 Tax=Vitis vinifera TaxID=29760 RepID=A0A438JDD2_VITVI|nr:hypothetical protein CK203_015147 [Vitis vinifera]
MSIRGCMDGMHHVLRGIAYSSPVLVESDLYLLLFIMAGPKQPWMVSESDTDFAINGENGLIPYAT